MLQVQDLRKSYGAAVVLDGATFILNDGEHAGLIGPNGAGKTTLLRIITGRDTPDSGTVVLSPRGARVGYLAQELEGVGDHTVGELIESAQGEIVAAEHAVQRAADALATAPDMEAAMREYDEALARFEALGGYEREHRAAAVLQGLSLAGIAPETPARTLSGGQKTRLGLALLLMREPELLLLDEPTNHLDVEALEWLEGFVHGYPNSVLVVSHDRRFLDATVSRVLYLDPVTRTVKSYEGNYSDFEAARVRERESQLEAWRRQQEYVDKVKRDIQEKRNSALAIEKSTTPRQPGLRVYARKKAAIAKSRERKLDRYLASDERVVKPGQSWWLKLDFGPAPAGGRSVLRVEDVSFAYPGNPPLFEHASFDVQYADRVALVGPNGAGKTTLLRVIEGTLRPTAGVIKLGGGVVLGVLAQEQDTLDPSATVLETAMRERPMSETDARTFLHFFLFEGDDVFRLTRECSPGERTRLQLAVLVLRGCNLLLLDEPLNHLDIEGRAHFQAALEAYEGAVIAVAHDRAFLHSYPERVIEVRDGRARAFEGGYEDYLAHRENA
ncbi:MAG TPA: ABC-F family ATP-binding cassette domain-containing protein [Chloroflexia bacterium]|nr:ABC-F family ATP-binding cassette domain-containing protein [Chloroflexia bacterium]